MTQDTQTPPQPRWYEPYVHENAPRWASIQHRDDNGETLLSTSEGAGDQLRLRQFIETFTAQQQRIEALESALRVAHDKMDDYNASRMVAGCRWCNYQGFPQYNGAGLIHDADCILVEMRALLSPPKGK